MRNVLVLGAGSWGTALALVLNDNGHNVTLWMRREEQLLEIKETKENKKYLPNIDIPSNMILTNDLIESVKSNDIIILAVPTQNIRGVLEEIKPYTNDSKIFVNVAKGIEAGTQLRVSEIFKDVIGNHPFVVLSGPSHAEEASKKMPTTIVSASNDLKYAELIQDIFSNQYFRVYTNEDIIGVELGGALKNIIAFGAGISDGIGYGDNAKAALMTRGIKEIARLGSVVGAEKLTFAGLAGIGDLIVTCTSQHSRNRKAGLLIGKGYTLDETLKEVGMVVEGIKTIKSTYELSSKLGVEMPITENLYKILYSGEDVEKSVEKLMGRKKKSENDEV